MFLRSFRRAALSPDGGPSASSGGAVASALRDAFYLPPARPGAFDGRFHGYPRLIHRLTYRRNGHRNLHVRGYKEEGTTTTPFDMCVLNDLDRLHLVSDVIDRVPKLGAKTAYAKQAIRDKLMEHKAYIARYGDDMPEITRWKWGQHAEASASGRSTEADNI